MRKTLLLIFILGVEVAALGYNDHRGHNVDSLERAVAKWTPDAIDNASDEELMGLNLAYRDLMLGYSVLNPEKSMFYARQALEISRRKNWVFANADAYRYIGQHFYARESFDSALVYYRLSMECVEQMAGGAVSPTSPQGYSQLQIDDQLSVLYGSIGNVYNLMDSIPRAMDYYSKASAIFDKYGWNESNSILFYNIGETYVSEGDMKKAREAYRKSEDYALAAGDSLLTANARKGLGRMYMEQGKTSRALRYLQAADEYYSAHGKEELEFTKENYEYMSIVLGQQRRMLSWMIATLTVLLLMSVAVLILSRMLRRTRKEQAETAAVMEETIREIKPTTPCDIQLSSREREILDLLSKGYTAPDIARALGLSNETIRWYRKKIIAKFDVSNTAELISMAKDMGLL